MGGDEGDAKDLGRVPSPGDKADHGDDSNTWGGRGVGIPPLVVAVEDYGLHPIGEYTSRWLATIA